MVELTGPADARNEPWVAKAASPMTAHVGRKRLRPEREIGLVCPFRLVLGAALTLLLAGAARAQVPDAGTPAADAQAPTAAAEMWLVTTSSGELFRGTMARAADPDKELVLTTQSGQQVTVPRHQVAVELLDREAGTVRAERMIRTACPASSYAAPPIRVITLSDGTSVVAEVHETVPGQQLRLRATLQNSAALKDVPWASVEQVRSVPASPDRCQPIPPQLLPTLLAASPKPQLGSPATASKRSPMGAILLGAGLGLFASSYAVQLVVAKQENATPGGYAPLYGPALALSSLRNSYNQCRDGCILYVFPMLFVAVAEVAQVGGLGTAMAGAIKLGLTR